MSWLTHHVTVDLNPKEQVGIPTDVATEDIVPPFSQAAPILSDASSEQEMLPDPQEEVIFEPKTLIDATNDISSAVELPCRYELPPRNTRGVLPRRYDPQFESQRSRYPISRDETSNMAHTTVAFMTSLYSNFLTLITKEALRDLRWQKAMKDEITTLKKNNTWESCMLPKGKKTVGCKWVYSIKYHFNGTIKRYKARLVAKGHTQTYGIDNSETFSPVAKIGTIRVLFSIAATKDLPLYQFDVKNTFLQGEI